VSIYAIVFSDIFLSILDSHIWNYMHICLDHDFVMCKEHTHADLPSPAAHISSFFLPYNFSVLFVRASIAALAQKAVLVLCEFVLMSEGILRCY
jgi:hypothetical protein